jgi:hypothetical protein
MFLRLFCVAPRTVIASRFGVRRRGGQVCPGHGALRPQDRLDRPLGDDVPAVLAGPGAHVDDPIRRADGLLVVLDDEHGVPDVAHAEQRPDQASVVALVEPDGRLVEDVEDAHEAGADLRREPDPLRLAAGEGRGRPIDRQVVEADVLQKAEPLTDILQHQLRDLALARAERAALLLVEQVGPLHRFEHGHPRHVDDVPVADLHREDLGLEPGAPAHRARPLAHVPLEVDTGEVARRLLV